MATTQHMEGLPEAGAFAGHAVGNYRIMHLIGQGGMGEVYRAEHQSRPGIRVAVKTLLPEISANRHLVERFFNEANAVSRIKHAGIVRIFDLGYLGDRAYLLMELLEGASLAQLLREQGALPVAAALDVATQAASAVHAAHVAGIIHRDIKPENLFLVEDHELAGGQRLKVLDFGIAKLAGGRVTSTGTMGAMGTPCYMAPEQWCNAADADARSDIYSLGCVLYETLVGSPPFPGQTVPECYAQHLTWPRPSARAVQPAVPPELDALLMAMMSVSRDERPFSMRDVEEALAAIRRHHGLEPAARWKVAQGELDASGKLQTTLGGSAHALEPGRVPARRRRVVAGVTLGLGCALVLTGLVHRAVEGAASGGSAAGSGSVIDAPALVAAVDAGAATGAGAGTAPGGGGGGGEVGQGPIITSIPAGGDPDAGAAPVDPGTAQAQAAIDGGSAVAQPPGGGTSAAKPPPRPGNWCKSHPDHARCHRPRVVPDGRPDDGGDDEVVEPPRNPCEVNPDAAGCRDTSTKKVVNCLTVRKGESCH